MEIYKAKVDEDGNHIEGEDGFFVKDSFIKFAIIEKQLGWGDEFSEDIRNDDWNYSFFTADGNHSETDETSCLTCHKPLENQNFLFSYQELVSFATNDGSDLFEESAISLSISSSDEYSNYLSDTNQLSLYLFTNDEQGSSSSSCSGGCFNVWPPLTIDSEDELPQITDGVDASLLNSFERDDGSIQVTYNGWPLYYYVGDSSVGDTNGQNVGSVWFLVSAEGEKISD